MNILIGNPMTPHKKMLAGRLVCLVTACATTLAFAAPGDNLAPPHAHESNLVDQPAGTAFSYLFIAGSAFHPLESATPYSYPGSGCIAKTGGTSNLFAHKVILPQGAVVRYLRLYYYDISSDSVTAFFTTYDGAGNYNQHTSVASADAGGGYGTNLSASLNHEVNRYTAAINVVANLGGQNDSTLRFCGVRIAYDAPVTDRIFANGFELTPL